ncbi:CDP-alcohol phosphatidyltransferase-domain-containing protein [Mrakia frigida]|uniref:CDP-diacylglycerol--inositol 3-phosphatidyltransferase n=1 Tax=Mrakia frigida TaxID=29902 RepID=UPI003FCBFB8C
MASTPNSPLSVPANSSSENRDRSPSVVNRKEALALATQSQENVFLFVPNLIGYARIILAGISLVVMPYHPKVCTALYFTSSILDVADGKAARALGQTSKFGAVLDMVTDRCATACLLTFLAMAYPSWALAFQFLITLDFSSHYMHMYSTLATGSVSHKVVDPEASWILWMYYNNTTTLFIFCFCNETFFVCLYLLAFWTSNLGLPSHLLSSTILAPSLPYLVDYPKVIAAISVADSIIERTSLPGLVAAFTGPIMFMKQVINGVQFWKASKVLVGLDLAERKTAREEKFLASRGRKEASA